MHFIFIPGVFNIPFRHRWDALRSIDFVILSLFREKKLPFTY